MSAISQRSRKVTTHDGEHVEYAWRVTSEGRYRPFVIWERTLEDATRRAMQYALLARKHLYVTEDHTP